MPRVNKVDYYNDSIPERSQFNTTQPTNSSIIRHQQSSTCRTESVQSIWPAQITLNHVARRKEVNRINKDNMVMLKALREVKPTVPRSKEFDRHLRKTKAIKENISQWRKVGKSQPRPRIQLNNASIDEDPELSQQD